MTINIFFRNIYIIGYKVASIINSSYYATLINNNMAMGFPHLIPKCNAIAICLQKWRHRGRGLLYLNYMWSKNKLQLHCI